MGSTSISVRMMIHVTVHAYLRQHFHQSLPMFVCQPTIIMCGNITWCALVHAVISPVNQIKMRVHMFVYDVISPQFLDQYQLAMHARISSAASCINSFELWSSSLNVCADTPCTYCCKCSGAICLSIWLIGCCCRTDVSEYTLYTCSKVVMLVHPIGVATAAVERPTSDCTEALMKTFKHCNGAGVLLFAVHMHDASITAA